MFFALPDCGMPHRRSSTSPTLRSLAVRFLALAILISLASGALLVSLRSKAPVLADLTGAAQEPYPESGTSMPDESVAALPDEPPEPPAEDGMAASVEATDAASPPSMLETALRLEKGDTLAGLLIELGCDRRDVANAMATLSDHANLRRLPVGQDIDVTIKPATDAEAKPILVALSVRPEAEREITLERDDDGGYQAVEKIYRIESRLGRVRGSVESSLIGSARTAGVPQTALADLLHAFAWDVDFQHDMKRGDAFDLLIEQSWTEDGRPLDRARMVWGALSVGGGREQYSVYRFAPAEKDESFYTVEGKSVVKALLRTPLNLSRVSSRFGLRRHPIVGFMRMHTGIDFAAPTGTPVLAAGAGRVVEAGRNGGYGKWVKISHGNGLATGYAHMSRIASGVRRSARVRQGQVIGFVGSTGFSTGPHLHFELHRGGKPVNPLTVARTAARERLAGAELERFKQHVIAIDQARENAVALE